jgi:hypothetical protein
VAADAVAERVAVVPVISNRDERCLGLSAMSDAGAEAPTLRVRLVDVERGL